jgi:hypothetical protein
MSSAQSAAPEAASLTGRAARRARRTPADVRTMAAILVAFLAIVGFAATVWYLLGSAHTTTDGSWQRLTYVFSGVQTVVFTAVGWLFGREVNRKAQERADAASAGEKAALARAADLDARAKAVKAAIAARRATYSDSAKFAMRGLTDETVSAASSDLDELDAIMHTLFPD